MTYNLKVVKAYKNKALGETPDKLTISQLKVVLDPLNYKEGGAIPTNKKVLIKNLIKWEGRGMITVEDEVVMVEAETAIVVQNKQEKKESDYKDKGIHQAQVYVSTQEIPLKYPHVSSKLHVSRIYRFADESFSS